MNFYLIYPTLINFVGHENQFIRIFNKICDLNKLNLKLFVNQKCEKIFCHNQNNYFKYNKHTSFLAKISNVKNFILGIKKILNNRKFDYLLIDGVTYNYILLFLLLINILNIKNKTFFVYFRTENSLISKKLIQFLINLSFNKIFILTDSSNLLNIFNKYYSNVEMLPIPHIYKKNGYINKLVFEHKEVYNIYLPGDFRKEKNVINNLIKILNSNFKHNLFLSESFKSSLNHNKITFIKSNLDPEEYIQQIKNVDIVILPYDNKSYKFRTSGIFYESISLNKILFVSNYTLMADELSKFSLNNFIIEDWYNFNEILSQIKSDKLSLFLSNSKNIIKFHGEKNYIDKFNNLIQ